MKIKPHKFEKLRSMGIVNDDLASMLGVTKFEMVQKQVNSLWTPPEIERFASRLKRHHGINVEIVDLVE